jgi:hypothetical protein
VSLERRPRRIAPIAGAVLVGLGLAASSPVASAAPSGDVGRAVGRTVETIPAAPESVPSLPSAASPVNPPTPHAPAEPPTRAAPTPPHSPTGGGPATPAVDSGGNRVDPTGIVKSATAGAPVRTTEAPVRTTLTGTNGDGRAALRGDSGSGSSGVPASGERSSAPPSIKAARVAPLQRWLAHVWPAIRLGGPGRASPVVAIAEDLLLRPAATLAQTLALAVAHAPRPVDSPLAGGPATANPRHVALPTAPPVGNREKTLYLIALVALMALLAFTVWREFRSALRPVRWRL